jgi:hypothetical protein
VTLVGSWSSVAGSCSSSAGGGRCRWQLGPVIAGGGSGWWPGLAGYQCRALEPSSPDVALEVLAQVRYQVGCASLEPNLEVGGELELPKMLVAAWEWWSFPRGVAPASGSSAWPRLG